MLSFTEVRDNNQNGHHNGNGTYVQGDADQNISTAVGFVHIYRFATMIPPEATLTSASLRVPIGVKNGDSTQSVSYTVTMVSSNNAAPLVNGENFSARPREGGINKTVTYTTGTNVFSDMYVDVTSMITSLMNKQGYVPGAYVIFALTTTAESGDINYALENKPFGGDKPILQINYTLPANPEREMDFNLLDNPTGGTDAVHWGENDAFGTFNVGGTYAVDNTLVRRTGVPTVKYTVPPTNPDNKPAAMAQGVIVPGNNKQYIYCGWIYIPSTTVGNLYPQFMFEWNGNYPIAGRDQWVPFCSAPSSVQANPAGLMASIHIDSGYTAGQNFWLSDCAVIESDFRQMPFNSTYPEGRTIDHNYTWRPGRGVVTRAVRINNKVKNGTEFTNARRYVLNSSGIWTLAETTRESMSWDELEANGMTWDQLEATGKTWAQLESEGV